MKKNKIENEFENFDKELLEKYYQDQCTQEERKVVEGWIAGIQHNKEINKVARKIWDITSTEGNQKSILNEVLYKIHYTLRLKEYYEKAGVRRYSRIRNSVMAITAAVIFALIGFWFGGHDFSGNRELYTEIHAPYGSRIKFDLPDGSSGWLNSGSSLKFPVKFTGRQRKVFLNGEGYFNVQHDENREFIVQTKNAQVVALGTSFDVLAYDDPAYGEEVTLVEGKLNIKRKLQSNTYENVLCMKPGEHIKLNTNTKKINLTNQNADKYISWKDGKLIFRNDPLERVVSTLEKYYNVDIEIKDMQLYNYHFHATFEDETLFETLRLLTLSSPIDYKILKREKNADGTYQKRKIILYLNNN